MDFLKRVYHKTRSRLGFRNKDDGIKPGSASPTYRPSNELDALAEEPKPSWFPRMRNNHSPSRRTRKSSHGSSKGWMSRIASTLRAPFRRKQHYEENFGGRKSKRRRPR